jgi:carboxyl-terminal processing protease
MNCKALLLLPILFLAACGGDSARLPLKNETASDCDELCKTRRTELSELLYVVEEMYSYLDEKAAETGIDYAQLNRELISRISSTTSVTEYYLILRQWAAAFRDGHVGASFGSNRIEIYGLPVGLEVLAVNTPDEKVVVARSTHAAAKIGDEVVAINGQPISEVLEQASNNIGGSTARMRRYWAASLLSESILGLPADGVSLDLKNDEGIKSVPMPVTALALPFGSPTQQAPQTSQFVTQTILPGNIGYLKIDTFSAENMGAFLSEAMNHLSRTKGLIIDVRANGGGDPEAASVIMSRLISQPIVKYKTRLRISTAVIKERNEYFQKYDVSSARDQKFSKWIEETVAPSAEATYTNPVVLLTGPACFSACDTFVSGMKHNKLAVVIGEGTGGGTGSPHNMVLMSGNEFRFSVLSGQTIDGQLLEGVGTDPDVYVAKRIEDIKNGKDTQLEKAGEVLGQLISAKTGTHFKITIQSSAQLSRPQVDLSPTMDSFLEWKTEVTKP